MSTVHQPQQSVQPDPARWAAFDAAWAPPVPALAGRETDNDKRWDAVAALAPELSISPIMRTTEAPRRMKEIARLIDEQWEADLDWDSPVPPCLLAEVRDGLDRSSWPTDAGDPDYPGYSHPDGPTADDELCKLLGLTYDLPGLLTAWADRLRLDQAPAWLVGRVRQLAATARFLDATTFEEFDAREAILEGDRDESLYAGGYNDAVRNPHFDPPFVA